MLFHARASSLAHLLAHRDYESKSCIDCANSSGSGVTVYPVLPCWFTQDTPVGQIGRYHRLAASHRSYELIKHFVVRYGGKYEYVRSMVVGEQILIRYLAENVTRPLYPFSRRLL